MQTSKLEHLMPKYTGPQKAASQLDVVHAAFVVVPDLHVFADPVDAAPVDAAPAAVANVASAKFHGSRIERDVVMCAKVDDQGVQPGQEDSVEEINEDVAAEDCDDEGRK